jgi:hypothetical protein
MTNYALDMRRDTKMTLGSEYGAVGHRDEEEF